MKTKAHPAVRGARFSDEQTKSFASGVTLRESIRYDIYVGTADALVAAGLMLAGQFPGQLGMRKVIVTIFADGTLPTGAPTANQPRAGEPGAKRIRRASKTTFSVSVRVADHIAECRLSIYHAERTEYEARMRAMPRPAALITGAPHSEQNAGNVIDLQAVRMAREQALTARQIEQRAPGNNSEQRLMDTFGEERRLLWVSQAEAEFLSDMYQHGTESAAKRLLQSFGNPLPELAPT